MKIGVSIEGGEKVEATLKKLVGIVNDGLEEVAVAGALPIVSATKQRCPVRTGNLKRSYHVGGHAGKSPDTKLPAEGEVSGPEKAETTVSVYVGTRVKYARPVEYGHGRAAAKPHLRPAFDDPGVREKCAKSAAMACSILVKRALGGTA